MLQGATTDRAVHARHEAGGTTDLACAFEAKALMDSGAGKDKRGRLGMLARAVNPGASVIPAACCGMSERLKYITTLRIEAPKQFHLGASTGVQKKNQDLAHQ